MKGKTRKSKAHSNIETSGGRKSQVKREEARSKYQTSTKKGLRHL